MTRSDFTEYGSVTYVNLECLLKTCSGVKVGVCDFTVERFLSDGTFRVKLFDNVRIRLGTWHSERPIAVPAGRKRRRQRLEETLVLICSEIPRQLSVIGKEDLRAAKFRLAKRSQERSQLRALD